MLFKEKLLLANCDSVHAHGHEELRKRFLTGLAFADGVVLPPNTLIDNLELANALGQTNVIKYLNEEGKGKFVIRGFGLSRFATLQEYYDALPDNFILSSLPGRPRKGELDRQQRTVMAERLRKLQAALSELQPVLDDVSVPREALQQEVLRRLDALPGSGGYFEHDGDYQLFRLGGLSQYSRSDWYLYAEQFFRQRGQAGLEALRFELIDPAYNSLFAKASEGFLQDNIRFLQGVPEQILDSSIAFKALRREIELVQYPIKVFNFISSLGAGEVIKFLTAEALGYLEDKMMETGESYMTRRNWFGLYPRMRSFMGLEIK